MTPPVPRVGDTVWFVEWTSHRGGISANRPYAATVVAVHATGVELHVLNPLHTRYEVARRHDPTGQIEGSWRERP